MVWKIARTFTLLCLCLLLAMPTQAHASEVYTDGNISSSYKDIFEDILHDISITDHYLFYRSGQYQYTLIVGDLELNGTVFSCSEYIRYDLNYSSTGYQGSVYDFGTISGTDFVLDVESYLVYSDLGHYPRMIERGVIYEYAILFALVVGGLCVLIRPIFKHTYRFRSR